MLQVVFQDLGWGVGAVSALTSLATQQQKQIRIEIIEIITNRVY